MPKKKIWYSRDNEPLILTKRGKSKFLINPRSGEVVAHNPLPLIPLAMMAAPHIAKAIGGFIKGKEEKEAELAARTPPAAYYPPRARGLSSAEKLIKLIEAEKLLR